MKKMTELEMKMIDNSYEAENKLSHARDIINMLVSYFELDTEETEVSRQYIASNMSMLFRNLELIDDLIIDSQKLLNDSENKFEKKREVA